MQNIFLFRYKFKYLAKVYHKLKYLALIFQNIVVILVIA